VQVTHPFHPLSGQRLVCVGQRYNRYGVRLLLQVDDERVCSVPRPWTDDVAPDPEVVLGGGHAVALLEDLMGLAELVTRVSGQREQWRKCKAIDDASVRETTPHPPPSKLGDAGPTVATGHAISDQLLEPESACGNIGGTSNPEASCRSDLTPRTRRPRPSSRRER
jgi:hypothetical protein